MIITKKALPRRSFLRGVGAVLALPLLESMVPALAKAQDLIRPAQRLFVGYVPNGIIMNKWTPKREGSDFEFPVSLQPLAPFRDQVSVLSGFACKPEADPMSINGGQFVSE